MSRHRIALALLAALGVGGAGAASSDPRPAGSQCRAGEAVLYSCRFGASIGSVCGSPGTVHYRFGPPGRPAIDIASDPAWRNVHRGDGVGGGSGGHFSNLRFTNGRYDYVVFTGTAGNLTDVPGRRWSGIHVENDGKTVAELACRGAAVDRLAELHRYAPGGQVPDETDDRFLVWY